MSFLGSKFNSAFSPQSIPGLVVWLDAADSNAVTQSGGAVSYWRDKSPLGIDVSQNTGAAQPTYESNVQNGLPALRFTTSQMMRSTSNFTVDKAQTWFISFKALTTTNYIFVEQGPNTNTSDGQFIYGGNNSLMYMKRGGATRFIDDPAGRGTSPFTSNVWYVCGLVTSNINTASTDVYWSINGVPRTCAISGTITGTATNQLYINNTSRVPASNYTGEIIIYNQALPSNQVRQVERYLAQKWGVTLSNTHPYFSVPAIMRPFNPLDVSGCSLWLDADDSRTLTLSGSNVTQWNDKSGSGYTATASGTASPTRSSSSRYLLFNGTTNALTLSTGALPSGNSAYSIFAVAYTNNVANPQWVLAGGSEENNRMIGLLLFTTSAVWHSWWANEYAVNNSISNGVPAIMNISYSTNRTTVVNGGMLTTNNPGTVRNNPTTGNFIGKRVTDVQYLDGGIGEIIVFSRDISTNERQQVELYLAEKWGRRSDLSSANPLRLYESLSPVFNPTLIPNCSLWLDFADRSSITLSGTDISGIIDKSGLGISVSTNTSRATLNSSYRNGLSAATFTGSQWFRGTFPTTYTGTTLAVFAVASLNSSTALNGRVVSLSTTATLDYTAGTRTSVQRNGTGQGIAAFRNPTTATASISAYNTPVIIETIHTGSTMSLYIDASLGSAPASSGSFGINTFGVGYLADYGATSDAAYWIGGIAEVVVYLGTVTDQQRQVMEAYLSKKWNIALPSNHPYYSTPV